ncbi:MAG: phospholipase D family protein [Rhodospirillales bacterium]|nr:phospholipase D family protein [Rhodospirillales bacterium]
MAETREDAPRKTFLLQGLTERTHLVALRTLLAQTTPHRLLLSVAYVTQGGVDLIASAVSAAGCRVDAFVGIRNGVTTLQGLTALVEAGANVHCVDTGDQKLLFHPKIYVAWGPTRAGAIIGSANLTVGGLNNNIESSVVLDLDATKDEDTDFLESICAEFDRLSVAYPQNIVRVERADELDLFYEQGRVADEASPLPPRESRATSGLAADVPTMSLPVDRLRGPSVRPPTPKSEPAPDTMGTIGFPGPSVKPKLIWRSKALTERDLGIPSGRNTHPTGSINLDKGLLDPSVDHRHYFREEVFAALDWGPTGYSTVEEAYARFRLIVKGIEQGEFKLRIGHTTSTTTPSYLQRNAMTRLSWGPTKEFVARRDLVGRTMTLYRDSADRTRFVIEID